MTKQLLAKRSNDAARRYGDRSDGAERLAGVLRSESVHVVFAESCTAGWVGACLAAMPGISEYFCGSVVAYRDRAKTDLLGIQEVGLELWSSVSAPIAAQMARNVLLRTTEADYAASITGYLGPDTIPSHKTIVFIGVAWRDEGDVKLYQVRQQSLGEQTRLARRVESTELLMHQLADCIEATCSKRVDSAV